MNLKDEINKNIDELDKEFNDLLITNNFNINNLESIMLNNLESYKNFLNLHVEELIANNINEKELISKKNSNGEKEDMN